MGTDEVYAGLEPRELWRHFGGLNRAPRPSRREEAARAYVRQVAEAAGALWTTDERGNTVVRVPASPGREQAPPVAVQAHLDMVCEKRPEVDHNFETDPIRPRIQGECVYGTGTTLGADNGIGAAAALALLTEPGLEHGPLELIFTVEEETGLHGAAALDPSLVHARMLVNLDSENPLELTIGCAGGAGAILHLPLALEPVSPGWIGREVVVSGLKGGHSGVQIHERLANAIKVLQRALSEAGQAGAEFRIGTIQGGNAHNAIPRDASARLAVAPESTATLEEATAGVHDVLCLAWRRDEPGLSLEVREAPLPEAVWTPEEGARVLQLLDDLPHGVLAMSEVFPGKVETSSNLAMVRSEGGELEIATSSRSFLDEELAKVQERIRACGEASGARVEMRDGYGGWEPDPGSRLLQTAVAVYERVFGTSPEVQVIHAGLECGVIASRLPGLQALSFGPRIEGAHTPEEHVHIPTVASTWRLLTALLAALGGGG
jgi:dipeptidase D